MNASEFIEHFRAAAQGLSDSKDDVNKLNVFPVPDGDTGTNMSLTILSVVKELDQLPAAASLADLRRAVTHGSLMGARGNSGVITSQILRGFCEGLEGDVGLDAKTLDAALAKAVEVSFAAVRRPVEGTILTVVSDMAVSAAKANEAGLDFATACKAIVDEAFASVQRTPELLPVLKENNVVDAGGYGLALLVQGFVASMTGEAVVVARDISVKPETGTVSSGPLVAIEQINDWEGSSYLYCTEFLMLSEDIDVEAAVDFLATMGDCELMVGSHPDFKVHVHTNQPGQVLEYMTSRGQVMDVHIHNMKMQTAERSAAIAADAAGAAGAGAAGAAGAAGRPGATEPKQRGYIAVASGPGIERILESLGVDVIVSGGQTMNPSTAELLEAIEAVNSKEVVVFPNNKNIIMAAQAAADVSDKQVAVIPTKSVPESFSALFVANANQPMEAETAEMAEAVSLVKSAEVTHAVKDAVSANGDAIKAGDVIGLTDDAIEVVGSAVDEVALELIGLIADDDCDTLTLLAGEQFGPADLDSLVARIEERYPDLEVDARRGDQPLYPLIMAAE